MKTWVKLYTEINRDPDMGTLTWAERGIWAALLALAGEIDDQDDDGPTGFIDTIEKVAWHLRCGLDELEGALHSFIARGMVDVDIDRQVTLINFGKRQRRAPSSQAERVAERVQRHRSKVKRGCNEDVTRRNALRKDSETDTDSEAESAAEADERETPPPLTDPLVGEVYTAWHNANGLLNPMHRDILGEYIDEYGAENVRDAIKESAQVQTSFGPRYVETVLRNWRTNGRNSGKARASPDNGEPVYRTALAEWVAEEGGT